MRLSELERQYEKLSHVDARIVGLLERNHQIGVSNRVLAVILIALTGGIGSIDMTNLLNPPPVGPHPQPPQLPTTETSP